MKPFGMRAVGLACETVELVQERGVFPIKVALVDEHTTAIYERLIIPTDAITDFRTWYHGITPEEVAERGIPFAVARKNVSSMLRNKIVVGYELQAALKTMLLDDDVPKDNWRDTATARIFRVETQVDDGIVFQKLKLAELADKHLQYKTSRGIHDAMEDAKVAMMLYRKYRDHSAYDWSNTSESTSATSNVTLTNEAALLQPILFQANLQKLLKEEVPDVDIKPILNDTSIPVRSKKKRRKSETGKNVKTQQNKSLHNKSNSIKIKSNVSKSQVSARARITKTDDQQVDDWLYGESAKIEGDEQDEDLRQVIENANEADKVDDEDEEDSVNVAIDNASKSGQVLDGDESEITGKEEIEEAGEEGGEGGNEDEDGDEDDEEDSDDDIVVTIGDIKAAPAAAAGIPGQAPFGTKRPAGPPPDKKGKFAVEDFEGTGTINGVPAQDFSLDSIEEKPWRKPGADLTDYFNYGFTEETWRAYCDRQKRLRYESGSSAPTMDRERKHHPQGGSHAMIPIVGSDNSKYNGPPNVIFPKKFGMQDRQKDGQRIQRSRDEHRENTIQVMTADRREYSRKTFDMPPPPMGPPPFDMSVPPPPFPGDMYRGPPDFFNHPPPQYYPEEHIDYEQQWMDNAWEMKGPGPSHVVPLTKVANLPPPPGESDDVLSKRTPPRKDDK